MLCGETMAYLVSSPNSRQEKIHSLHGGCNRIGRSLDNDIVILDESMSRHHAEIVVSGDHIQLRDLQSLNHTFVNDQEIQEVQLRSEDQVRFGNVVCYFHGDPPPRPESLEPTQQLDLAPEPAIDSTIVKKLSPEQSRFAMEDILSNQESGRSVIKLRHEDQNQRAVDKLKILLEVCQQLSSPDETSGLLQKILNLLFTIMHVDRGAILLWDREQQQLQCRITKFRFDGDRHDNFYSTQITNYVFTHGEGIISANAQFDQRFDPAHSIFAQNIQASMCVPLKPRDRVIGVIYVDNISSHNVYGEEDLEFLAALANQAAIAIDNSQLQRRMQEEAVIRDKLERFFPQTVTRKLRETDRLDIVDTEVTALFADISGFTEMSSTMEPRQVIAMLNEYFQVMVEEIVFRYQGTLEKYIGDALFAVWGAPYRHPDDPIQAVKAAVEMQNAVIQLNERWLREGKRAIQIHIGLNTGKVAAGNIGSDRLIQYATIGDTTNVTSRICNVAQGGEIVLSARTYAALADLNLPCEGLPPTPVKGKAEPLRLYKLRWQECHFS